MRKRSQGVAAGAAALIVIGGAGVAAATGGGDDESPITGNALDRASEVALDHTGEGKVTETEVDDEEGYYEVEVTLDDGSEVDVHLDKDFKVLGSEGEDGDEGSDDGE